MAELIVALDVPSRDDAMSLVERLPGLRWVKVGPVLFVRSGPSIVEELVAGGLQVFLDLKWHDIPNTVCGGVNAARELGVAMATVHALGGRDMMAAAQAIAGDVALVAVTILTSHGASDLSAALGREEVRVEAEVLRLAGTAVDAGLRGVVSSPHEVAGLRRAFGPDLSIVVPGIRSSGVAVEDQRRVASASEAVAAGATHLVVGRPISQAPDPAAAFEELQMEMHQ